jgi:hypothetical protein
METATIIVSRDFQFVSSVINHLKDDLFHSTIERSIGSDDFEVLLNELIDENLRIISVICDSNLSLNDLNEIRKVIKKYDSQIHYSLVFGFQTEDIYMD